ncbi:VanZ family protein [Paenibacillus chartarius]|uniref:VanZ family protein n=1 Tax=Paenibacillus chartarius TaxID=747481 RepID=A0ABV6DRV7_9BACL
MSDRQRHRKIAIILWLAAALLWMAFIYYKSSQTYSEQDMRPQLAAMIESAMLSRWLPQIEFSYGGQPVTYKRPYDMAEFFVRKGGHLAEYAVLAWLWLRVLYSSSITGIQRYRFVIAAAISLLYAGSDEWHQSFVPNRTGHAIDVAVDAAGIGLALLLEFAVRGRLRRREPQKK